MQLTKSDYSKPSADVAIEAQGWMECDRALLARQREISQHLLNGLQRKNCLLCGNTLEVSHRYVHRGVDYLQCIHCGHLQTRIQPPAGYPHDQSGSGFEAIYPQLDGKEYLSRRDRIYMPKLEWLLSRVNIVGYSVESALSASWLDFGCGAGYFLHALRGKGARNVIGLDENADLIAEANRHCGGEVAHVSKILFEDLEASSAEIITAFFVLEHIEEAATMWRILGDKPRGTLFAFAVPTFGLSTIIEGAVHDFAARNLDNGVHTQLYTDRSIDHALEQAGYRKVAEWLFGQDAQDLCRILLQRVTAHMDPEIAAKALQQLNELVDPLQNVIDRARFCDARHVLAEKL